MIYSKEEWARIHPNPHWLFQVFPFLTHFNLEPDELHILYLGTMPVMIGSVLHLLCYRCLPRSPSENMDLVWSLISEYYSSQRVSTQFSSLSLGSFTSPEQPNKDYPVLKGKGAELKDIIGAVLHVWELHGSYEYAMVRDLLSRQAAMCNILSANAADLFLSNDQAISFGRHNDALLDLYTQLARKADEAGELLWKMLPKHNWQCHVSQKARWLNPRASACMIDEDFVGHQKLIVGASVHGTPPEDVPMAVMAKAAWTMHFANIPSED